MTKCVLSRGFIVSDDFVQDPPDEEEKSMNRKSLLVPKKKSFKLFIHI